MSAPAVVLMTRQAGTAAAFLSVAEHLAARRPVVIFACPPSDAVWRRAGAAAIAVEDLAEALPTLEALTIGHVLTGTSLSVEADASWWDWAAGRGIPCTAFVDQWANYWQRFTSPDATGRFDRCPPRIAVIDPQAARAMTAAGCPAGRVIVAGTPAFDLLQRSADPGGEHMRAESLPAHADHLVLFVCEPPTPPLGPQDFKRQYGFEETEVLALVVAALGRLAARTGRSSHLVCKRHPIQVAAGSQPCLPDGSAGVSVGVSDGDRYDLVRASDLVVGMRSMLLLEASLIGRPVISLQPGRLMPSEVTDHRRGIQVIEHPADLDDALAAVMATQRRPLRLPHTPRLRHAERFCKSLGLE